MKSVKDKRIWVIGASSGIGAALCEELSSRGAKLILSARRSEKLNDLNKKLGGTHEVQALDVGEQEMVAESAKFLFSKGAIDSVIFLAGLYEPAPLREMTIKDAEQITKVNLIGAYYLLHAILPSMRKQKSNAQIVLCGSVAGYIGLPNGQPYSASKAALTNLAESLYAEEPDLDIKLISPGFVETPLTNKNDFDMPMKIKPEEAAKEIADGLIKKRFEIHFPKKFTYIMKMLQFLPYRLLLGLTRKMAKKRVQQE